MLHTERIEEQGDAPFEMRGLLEGENVVGTSKHLIRRFQGPFKHMS